MPEYLHSVNPDNSAQQWFIGEEMVHEFWPSSDEPEEAIKYFDEWANKIRELMKRPNIRGLHIEREPDYEGGHYLMLKWEYLETTEQRDERLADEQKYADERAAKERAEYERLQAKFGK